jgi:hypothetical protein
MQTPPSKPGLYLQRTYSLASDFVHQVYVFRQCSSSSEPEVVAMTPQRYPTYRSGSGRLSTPRESQAVHPSYAPYQRSYEQLSPSEEPEASRSRNPTRQSDLSQPRRLPPIPSRESRPYQLPGQETRPSRRLPMADSSLHGEHRSQNTPTGRQRPSSSTWSRDADGRSLREQLGIGRRDIDGDSEEDR